LLGFLFALASAFLWALVAILYRAIGRTLHPIAINIGKNLVALFCIGIILAIKGFEPIGGRQLFFLVMSGALGISLGDTFFLMALCRIRARLAMLMTTLIPVLAVLLAVLLLHERPTAQGWIGIIVTLMGIGVVLSGGHQECGSERNSLSGILYGLLASVCCAASVICSKYALASVSALDGSFVRHIAGFLLLALWGLAAGKLTPWLKPLISDAAVLRQLLIASFLGAFLGTWFCLLGLKYATASAATVLNATSPLFILPLSYILLKERISSRAIIGAVVAVAGGCILLAGG